MSDQLQALLKFRFYVLSASLTLIFVGSGSLFLIAVEAFTVAKGLPQAEIEALALASQKVQHAVDGANIKKIIVVPDRLVNIVL